MGINIKSNVLSNYMATMPDSNSIYAEDKEMTPEKALRIGRMIGCSFKAVSIGMDANPSSKMIKNSVISGLISMGADVKDMGMTPDAVISSIIPDSECIVTISEPNEQGAISKVNIFNPDGSVFTKEQTRQLIKVGESEQRMPNYKDVGALSQCNSAIEEYIDMMVKRHGVCAETPVILDCGCGCTSLCAPHILSAMNADLTTINAQVGTKFSSRPPGVEEDYLQTLINTVSCNIGSIGIALNGNGTRFALIDEEGKYVNPELTISLILLYLRPSSLVVPINTSAVIDDAFYDIIGEGLNTPSKTQVEHRIYRTNNDLEHITQMMREKNAEIGVLDDGTMIFSDISMCPDAINAAAILTKMSGENSIKNLLASFPKYVLLRESIQHTGNPDVFGKKLTEKLIGLNEEGVWQADGWRTDMDHGRFTISRNNEFGKLIEITAESKDRAYAVSMMELAKEIVHSCM
jgi:Phosphomannomutase